MPYYWLSFVADALPAGNRFVGGCVVEADSQMDALVKTHVLRINPGGEVAMVEIPTGQLAAMLDKFQPNRLYTIDEIRALGEYRTLGDMQDDATGDVT